MIYIYKFFKSQDIHNNRSLSFLKLKINWWPIKICPVVKVQSGPIRLLETNTNVYIFVLFC